MSARPPVLVVDDDAISRHVLTQALESAGLPCEVVASGSEALVWLKQNVPRLVLLDLMMPPPDGYAVLRTIRGDARTEEVPVVVLTALEAEDDVTKAFDMGADDFVRKPFRTAELIARIRSQLRLREYVEALARKEHDSKVVLELTQALSSTLDFRNILYTVVRRIAEVVRVDRCSIVLAQESAETAYVVAASDDRDLRDLPIELKRYPEIREVMNTGRPLVIEDANTHPLFDMVRAGLPTHSFRSLALLPILFEQKPMGVLFLRGKRPVALREHELSLARTVANATAIALRNARILQSLRDRTNEVTFAKFEAEKRLKALQHYADFFNAAADGIAVLDLSGRVLFSNPRAQEIVGRTEQELSNIDFDDMVVDNEKPLLRQLGHHFRTSKTTKTTDITILTGPASQTPGMRRILDLSVVHLAQEGGDAVLVSFRDVTQDRSTASELRQTKEFLERVISSSVDAIISADLRGRVLLFNPAAERIYRLKADEVVGKMNAANLYPDGVAQEIMHRIRSPEFGPVGRLEDYRTEVVTTDGQRVPVLISASLILEDGKPVGSVGIFTDLRERLQMEARLTEAQEELRNREKQALIAELAGAAAHELNQPLTSVMGYAEILRRRAQPNIPKEVDVISREAERMAEIVKKIGKITKYETKSYVGEAKIIDIDRSSTELEEPG